MKIDYDLVREMLIAIEDFSDGLNIPSKSFRINKFPTIDKSIIDYHLQYLADKGFAKAELHGQLMYLKDITTEGRDFLKNIADIENWEKLKETLNPLQDFPSNIIIETAEKIFREKMN